ncbi:MAG: hypothetical protein NVS2B12_39410 [Ktedonobacteraceae bacterium]
MSQASLFGAAWQGSLNDLATIVHYIRRSHAFGRLSLRNLEQLSIAHLYFRAGKLIHIVGHRGDARTILIELQNWKRAMIRFDRGVASAETTLNDEYEQLFLAVLDNLQQRGLVIVPNIPAPVTSRVIEGDLIATSDAKQLIAPWEWHVLVEGTRRVSLAVAHVVGPREAFAVLKDILEDCAASFPAFASLKIAPSGYLYIADRSQLDHMSREDLLEGFAALIAICQYFCSPIVGERNAHKLMLQSLQELGPPFVSLGVFRVDNQLLFNNNSNNG